MTCKAKGMTLAKIDSDAVDNAISNWLISTSVATKLAAFGLLDNTLVELPSSNSCPLGATPVLTHWTAGFKMSSGAWTWAVRHAAT
jgi:hypothetical protein